MNYNASIGRRLGLRAIVIASCVVLVGPVLASHSAAGAGCRAQPLPAPRLVYDQAPSDLSQVARRAPPRAVSVRSRNLARLAVARRALPGARARDGIHRVDVDDRRELHPLLRFRSHRHGLLLGAIANAGGPPNFQALPAPVAGKAQTSPAQARTCGSQKRSWLDNRVHIRQHSLSVGAYRGRRVSIDLPRLAHRWSVNDRIGNDTYYWVYRRGQRRGARSGRVGCDASRGRDRTQRSRLD